MRSEQGFQPGQLGAHASLDKASRTAVWKGGSRVRAGESHTHPHLRQEACR